MYRLAHMPIDFSDRWCVQLLSNRMIRYLDRVADRHGVRLGLRPGEITVLDPRVVQGLPGTARKALERWQADTKTVRAVCQATHEIGNELRLVAHSVEPASAGPQPSDCLLYTSPSPRDRS